MPAKKKATLFPRNYLVYASSPSQRQGKYIGRIEAASDLLSAAQSAAELLLFRNSIRQVASIVDSSSGVFIASGKAKWMVHPKGTQEEVRFLIQLEQETEEKREGKGRS
jgi:hypothetical protein